MISVVVTTWNRPALLRQALRSLVNQSLEPDHYELVVVDDGSETDVSRVVDSCQDDTRRIHYVRQPHSGLAAAKNKGMECCHHDLVLFFDDDDIADHDLLARHVESHCLDPGSAVAVLGFTDWSPQLEKTPLMTYLTEVGENLFGYRSIDDGALLYYWHFWGGRTSMKRKFLAENGRFDPEFAFGCEDIELGYRLHPHGLRVRYNASAVSWMNRPLVLREACRRQERMSWAKWRLYQMHPDEPIRNWVSFEHCEGHWDHCGPMYEEKLTAAEAMEAQLDANAPEDRDDLLRELHIQYEWLLKAASFKGLVSARSGEVRLLQN